MRKKLFLTFLCLTFMLSGCTGKESTEKLESSSQETAVATDSQAVNQTWNDMLTVYQDLSDTYNAVVSSYNRDSDADEEINKYLDRALELIEQAGNIGHDALATDEAVNLVQEMVELKNYLQSEEVQNKIQEFQNVEFEYDGTTPLVSEDAWENFQNIRKEVENALSEHSADADPAVVSQARGYLESTNVVIKEAISQESLSRMTDQLQSYLNSLQ